MVINEDNIAIRKYKFNKGIFIFDKSIIRLNKNDNGILKNTPTINNLLIINFDKFGLDKTCSFIKGIIIAAVTEHNSLICWNIPKLVEDRNIDGIIFSILFDKFPSNEEK